MEKIESVYKVFLGCIPGDSVPQDIMTIFSRIASISEVHLTMGLNKKGESYCLGYGFLYCKSQADVDTILSLDHPVFYRGRKVIIKKYKAGKDLESEKDKFNLRRLFMSMINNGIDTKRIKATFERFGAVESFYLVEQPKGKKYLYGFVAFYQEKCAQEALKYFKNFKPFGREFKIEQFVGKTTEENWKSPKEDFSYGSTNEPQKVVGGPKRSNKKAQSLQEQRKDEVIVHPRQTKEQSYVRTHLNKNDILQKSLGTHSEEGYQRQAPEDFLEPQSSKMTQSPKRPRLRTKPQKQFQETKFGIKSDSKQFPLSRSYQNIYSQSRSSIVSGDQATSLKHWQEDFEPGSKPFGNTEKLQPRFQSFKEPPSSAFFENSPEDRQRKTRRIFEVSGHVRSGSSGLFQCGGQHQPLAGPLPDSSGYLKMVGGKRQWLKDVRSLARRVRPNHSSLNLRFAATFSHSSHLHQ